jgi:hypothetical protein
LRYKVESFETCAFPSRIKHTTPKCPIFCVWFPFVFYFHLSSPSRTHGRSVKREGFRVIISGGDIAGLSLANALQHAGLDYILLEARAVIVPQVGASIGMLPNGSRVLDQLGCYDETVAKTEPLIWGGNHDENGDYRRQIEWPTTHRSKVSH